MPRQRGKKNLQPDNRDDRLANLRVCLGKTNRGVLRKGWKYKTPVVRLGRGSRQRVGKFAMKVFKKPSQR
jgi:hypothetical protein